MQKALASALAIVACAGGIAGAQTLYKWVDRDGKTHYSDKAPAGFKGEVTRIEADAPAASVSAAPPSREEKPAKAQPAKEEAEEDKPADIATKRRRLREELAARVAAAHAKVEAARKALEVGEPTEEGEQQMVQQRHARNASRPERTPQPRSNCMARNDPDGTPFWMCPTPVRGDAYFERQKALEEGVRKAEAELAEAENAYRRGVD